MDANLMSCPACGHSVSNDAAACAYCGSAQVEQGQQPQADDKDVGEKSQVVESPPPLPQKEIPPADKTSDEAGEIPIAAPGPSDSDVSQQAADSPATAETSETATKAETVSENKLISVDDEVESKPPDDEQDLKSTPESDRIYQDVENASEIAPAEAVGPESVPEADVDPAAEIRQDIQEPEAETIPAVDNVVSIGQEATQTETATEDIQSPPEPEQIDIAGVGTGESETLGEMTTELVEIEAAQPELDTPPTLEKTPPLVKAVEDAKTKPVEDLQPKIEEEITIDADAGAILESSGDTIFLEVDAEDSTIDAEVEAISESSGETIFLEVDAEDSTIDAEAGAISESSGDTILQEVDDKDNTIDAKAGAISESLGDTILLEEMDEEEITIDAKPGSISKSAGDSKSLERVDKIEPATGELPVTSDKSDSQNEALKIEKDVQEMAAAIEKQRTSFAKAQKKNRQEAALAKAQALKKQNAAQAKSQALEKQKLVLANAAALKRKKAAQTKAQALEKQKAAQALEKQKAAQTLEKQKAAQTLVKQKAAQALVKQKAAQALKNQKAAQADIEAAKQKESATATGQPKLAPNLETGTRMQALLAKYKGRVIGINYDNSAEIKEAQLIAANAEYFRVFVKDKNLHYSYPFKAILTVIEGKDGVEMGDAKQSNKFIAVIKVYPLVLF